MGTGRTCDVMVAAGLPAEKVCKINEGRPNILDKITNGKWAIIINTPNDKKGEAMTATSVRAAVRRRFRTSPTWQQQRLPYRLWRSIKKNGHPEVKSLQEFHSEIQ